MHDVSKKYTIYLPTSKIIGFKTLEDNIISGQQQNSKIPKYKNISKNTRYYFWSDEFKNFKICSLFGKSDTNS